MLTPNLLTPNLLAPGLLTELRDRGPDYIYIRDLFNHRAVYQYPDTSSTWHIITSSAVELVSAFSIVSLVTVLVRMYYTRPGTSSDAGSGLGAVYIPFLAGYFTFWALIVAAFTAFAIEEMKRSRRLSRFIPFSSDEPQMCYVCLQSDSATNLVNLQCYSDEEEAANPQRLVHWYHETCLEKWWLPLSVENRTCPACQQRPLAYRAIDAEYRYPAPQPSVLLWAMYSFFTSCSMFFWDNTKPIAMRGLPGWQNSLGEHFMLILCKGVLALGGKLLARILFVRALYKGYLALPDGLKEYPLTYLQEYIQTELPILIVAYNFLPSTIITLSYKLAEHGSSLGSHLSEVIEFHIVEYFVPFLRLLEFYLSPDFGPANDWFLCVSIIVLPLIFLHGFATRISEFVFIVSSHLLVENQGPPPDTSVARVVFVSFLSDPFAFDQGYATLILTIVIWSPMVLRKLSRAWYNFRH
ncbi:hypothetical protein CIB48_g10693 [Xylaria polymorpha]|nr:hypothetical protein CIB48_g10693 [Xylaria polymorpha]